MTFGGIVFFVVVLVPLIAVSIGLTVLLLRMAIDEIRR